MALTGVGESGATVGELDGRGAVGSFGTSI